MLTVIGNVLRPDGWCLHANELGEVDEVAYVPAGAYVSEQPADIPIYFDHDHSWRIGSVIALERSDRLGLMAVATIDADVRDLLDDGPWFWSDGITCKRLGKSLIRGQAVIHELSLVRRTANCGTSPIVVVPGDITRGTAPQPRAAMSMFWDDTWERAAEATPRRRAHMTIFDVDELTEVDRALADPSRLLAPTPMHTKKRGNVWMNGVELDDERSARILDLMELGY